MNEQEIRDITTSLLELDIIHYLDQPKHKSPFTAVDVLGRHWTLTKHSNFYKNVYYPIYNEDKTAGRQIGKLFKKAAKKLGLVDAVIKGSKGLLITVYFKQ